MTNYTNFKSKTICLSFVLLFLFSLTTNLFSQKTRDNQQLIIWQQRVETLIDGIIKDSSSVADTERAIYLALLSKVLWKTDSGQAKPYLKKSADLTIESLKSDDKTDLAVKIKNTQKVVRIIAGLDENLSRDLAEQFTEVITDKAKNSEQNAETLISIGLQVVEKNPQAAFEIGIRSLNYGNSPQITRLIAELIDKDPKLAEQLFSAVLISVAKNYSFRIISRLSVTVFTTFKGKSLSDSARQSFLTTLARLIPPVTADELERRSGCEVIIIAAPLIDKFNLYFPDLTPAIKQQIQLCQAFIPKSNSGEVEAGLKEDKPRTADELISAARKTEDKFLKLKYYHEAIVQLDAAKKFDQILSLLDGITQDEIKILGKDTLGNGIWEGWYEQYATPAIIQYVKNKDFSSVYRILNRVPSNVKPTVRMDLASKLPVAEYKPYILENLEAARKESASIDATSAKKAGNYLGLIHLYAKFLPFESAEVFRQAVKAINYTDDENPDNKPEKDYSPLMDVVSLPSEILNRDEISVFNLFREISSRRSRVRLKLGLLKSSLEKYQIEKKKIEIESVK